MSAKQVPENQVQQLPIPEQMRRLELWVKAHWEIFQRCRNEGLFRHLQMDDFLTPDPEVSPTAALRDFNRLVGDIRVFFNQIAVFNRDGCSVAANTLRNALLCVDRWDRPVALPFEDVGETEPMVLLMFEPAKMFPIMRWFPNRGMQLDVLYKRAEIELTEETLAIAKILPSLHQNWLEGKRTKSSHLYQGDVFEAIQRDVLADFNGFHRHLPNIDPSGGFAWMYTGETLKPSSFGTRDNFVYAHEAYDGVAFAYLFRGMRQANVLGRIPRALQGRVATWQFDVYAKTWYGVPKHRIMFIPEAELPQWQGIYQSSLSKGAAAGHVAVFNPERVFQSLPDGRTRDMKSVIVLDNR